MKTKFEIESTSRHGEFIDIECVDGSAKRDLRSWQISIDCDEGTAQGILRRSPDTETAFDDGVDLPPRLVRLILKSIGVPALPRHALGSEVRLRFPIEEP